MQKKDKEEKRHTPMLIIGLISIALAMIGGYLLEPPAAAEPPQDTEIPEAFRTVLEPAALTASPAAQQTFTVTSPPSALESAGISAVTPQASGTASPRSSASPAAWRTSGLTAATVARASAPTARPERTATRKPTAVPTRTAPAPASAAPPVETSSPAPTPAETIPQAVPTGVPTAVPDTADPEQTLHPNGTPEESSVDVEGGDHVSRAAKYRPAEVTPLRPAVSPTPVVSLGGGLLPGAGSRYTITREGVDAAGGMKVIEGFRADGTAVVRDIRNTLMTSSSLVKAYRDGEEIGGFDTVGTGTVLELSDRAGDVVDTAVVLIPGDITGTGTLSIVQLVRLAAALDGSEPLSGANFMAADYDASGTLDEGDLMALSYALRLRLEREAQTAPD